MPTANSPRRQRLLARLIEAQRQLESRVSLAVEGKLTRMVGLTLEAMGCQADIGGRCLIQTDGDRCLEAEVVGFAGEKLFLMPAGDLGGLGLHARVIPVSSRSHAAVGPALLGRVVDGAGCPLDGKGALKLQDEVPLAGRRINPLARRLITQPLNVGVRAINALLTVGRGQRMGLFAGSGVGKSVLLGMMTRFTEADVIVVGLIGERGREVKEFIEHNLGAEGMARSVVVATPADTPPLMRLHGAMLATSIAEYFRDQGKHVLLLMDSLTRFAQAQREIALAIGEPPATKGYPPSVFAKLPQLVERAGNGENGGSITAFYTVLVESDDHNDPVVDAVRAIVDGHVVLSRRLADSGHYPAIDIEASISRAMTQIVDEKHRNGAIRFRHLYSTFEQHQDLISVGAYSAGSDPLVDEAIAYRPRLMAFLKQDMNQSVSMIESTAGLHETLAGPAENKVEQV